MNPNESVRIKYLHDDEIKARNTGGVVPRIGETICLLNEKDVGGIYEQEWFEVHDVMWDVYADSPERKPDVVTIKLEEWKQDE